MSKYDVEKFDPPPDPDLVCCICHCVLDKAVESPCQHVFCQTCIERWLTNRHTCPTCRKRTRKEDLKPVLPLVQNMLNRLLMLCDFRDNGCMEKIMLEHFEKHISSCGYEMKTCRFRKCGLKILRLKLAKHEAEECDHRELLCEGECGLMIPLSELENHNCVQSLKQHIDEKNKLIETLKSKLQELNTLSQSLNTQLEQLRVQLDERHPRFSYFSPLASSDTDVTEFSLDDFSQSDLSEDESQFAVVETSHSNNNNNSTNNNNNNNNNNSNNNNNTSVGSEPAVSTSNLEPVNEVVTQVERTVVHSLFDLSSRLDRVRNAMRSVLDSRTSDENRNHGDVLISLPIMNTPVNSSVTAGSTAVSAIIPGATTSARPTDTTSTTLRILNRAAATSSRSYDLRSASSSAVSMNSSQSRAGTTVDHLADSSSVGNSLAAGSSGETNLRRSCASTNLLYSPTDNSRGGNSSMEATQARESTGHGSSSSLSPITSSPLDDTDYRTVSHTSMSDSSDRGNLWESFHDDDAEPFTPDGSGENSPREFRGSSAYTSPIRSRENSPETDHRSHSSYTSLGQSSGGSPGTTTSYLVSPQQTLSVDERGIEPIQSPSNPSTPNSNQPSPRVVYVSDGENSDDSESSLNSKRSYLTEYSGYVSSPMPSDPMSDNDAGSQSATEEETPCEDTDTTNLNQSFTSHYSVSTTTSRSRHSSQGSDITQLALSPSSVHSGTAHSNLSSDSPARPIDSRDTSDSVQFITSSPASCKSPEGRQPTNRKSSGTWVEAASGDNGWTSSDTETVTQQKPVFISPKSSDNELQYSSDPSKTENVVGRSPSHIEKSSGSCDGENTGQESSVLPTSESDSTEESDASLKYLTKRTRRVVQKPVNKTSVGDKNNIVGDVKTVIDATSMSKKLNSVKDSGVGSSASQCSSESVGKQTGKMAEACSRKRRHVAATVTSDHETYHAGKRKRASALSANIESNPESTQKLAPSGQSLNVKIDLSLINFAGSLTPAAVATSSGTVVQGNTSFHSPSLHHDSHPSQTESAESTDTLARSKSKTSEKRYATRSATQSSHSRSQPSKAAARSRTAGLSNREFPNVWRDDSDSDSDTEWRPTDLQVPESDSWASETDLESDSSYEVLVPKTTADLLNEYASDETDDSWIQGMD